MNFKTTHIALKVSNFDKAVEFYQKVLFAKVTKQWGEGENRICLATLCDGTSLEIFAGGKKSEINKDIAGGFFHFAVKTDDCQKAFDNAILNGAREKISPQKMDIPSDPVYPVKIAFVYGLDNEEIEFFEEL
ncbi:MAG: VOC family protein [Oscillospiraceae bacterium]